MDSRLDSLARDGGGRGRRGAQRRGAAEAVDRLPVEDLGVLAAVSSARERASMPSVQSVPLARVIAASRSSAPADRSGVPVLAAASMSSAIAQLEISCARVSAAAWAADSRHR